MIVKAMIVEAMNVSAVLMPTMLVEAATVSAMIVTVVAMLEKLLHSRSDFGQGGTVLVLFFAQLAIGRHELSHCIVQLLLCRCRRCRRCRRQRQSKTPGSETTPCCALGWGALWRRSHHTVLAEFVHYLRAVHTLLVHTIQS